MVLMSAARMSHAKGSSSPDGSLVQHVGATVDMIATPKTHANTPWTMEGKRSTCCLLPSSGSTHAGTCHARLRSIAHPDAEDATSAGSDHVDTPESCGTAKA